MNITNRGKIWEILNSLWIIWSFTLVLSCVGFFGIGGRAGKRKWIYSGLIYLIVNFGLIYVSQWLRPMNATFADIINIVIYGGFFAGIIQSFMSRKEYLVRREAVLDLKNATREAYRNEIREDYFGNNTKPDQRPISAAVQSSPETQTSAEKFNLNICSEQEFQHLPGVGVVLAKRAVETRSQIGGFAPTQDFIQRLGLMPHFAVQIERLAFVTPIRPKVSPSENTGRIIDI